MDKKEVNDEIAVETAKLQKIQNDINAINVELNKFNIMGIETQGVIKNLKGKLEKLEGEK